MIRALFNDDKKKIKLNVKACEKCWITRRWKALFKTPQPLFKKKSPVKKIEKPPLPSVKPVATTKKPSLKEKKIGLERWM